MSMTPQTLFYLNDNLLRLTGLRDALSGTYIDSATVTVTLKDRFGNAVSGVTWPLVFSPAGGGTGDYSVVIPDDIQVMRNVQYTAEIIADDGPGRRAVWELPVQVVTRQS